MAVGEIAQSSETTVVLPAPPSVEWLELGRHDGTTRFVELNRDLSRAFDRSGDGKRITSGHAFAELASAVAWASVGRDPLCGPPRQSTASFRERWHGLRTSVPVEPCHYVSLGPGDGRKDGVVLADLSLANRDLCYLPVDTSEELLHLAVQGLMHRLELPADRIMSLPWDFAPRENIRQLRSLLDELFGTVPVTFSLLGGTIGGFDDDAAVLQLIATLLRPGDRLLLEVEATTALDGLVPAAVGEYAGSPAFGEFVTSSLRHHTDLPADLADVEFLGAVEDDRALVVKTVYRAREDTEFTLPNRTTVPFTTGDTIRLALSRKYSPEGLARLVAGAGLTVVADVCAGTGGPFGLALLMLEVQARGVTRPVPQSSSAPSGGG
jgi:L-histidine N-alpha-methyltransferase